MKMTEDENQADRRGFKRASLLLTADVSQDPCQSTGSEPAIVMDLSATGAKLRRGDALGTGATVTLSLAGRIFFEAMVIWEKGPFSGLKFMHGADEIAHVLAGLLPNDCLTPAKTQHPIETPS
ncbi:MAG: PilZ domain-containing protein [Pseudomonadota bacterium]